MSIITILAPLLSNEIGAVTKSPAFKSEETMNQAPSDNDSAALMKSLVMTTEN